jgi:hypothetical protein
MSNLQGKFSTSIYVLDNLLTFLVSPDSQKWLKTTKKHKRHNPLELRGIGALEKLRETRQRV